MEKVLDEWFFNLELKELERIFFWPQGKSDHAFIEDCDDYWRDLTRDEKEWFYEKYQS